MKNKPTQYSTLVQRSSSHMHQFIHKLCRKGDEKLHFILVHDAERSKPNQTNSAHSAHSLNSSNDKQAVLLHKPLLLLEKQVPHMKLISKNNKSIHLLSQNAKGYAVFMEINRRDEKSREIKEIRAQFIDVDLNKISEQFQTKEQLKARIKQLKSDPLERIQSITIKKGKQGQYLLRAQRAEEQVAQLKKTFLKKHWQQIKNAMIIETKNGYHIYWVIQNGSISKFVPIQKALASKFGSDPMITNLSRVMRIPGFYHLKNPDKPYLVRVIHSGRKQPFTQEELIQTLMLRP
ncbi:DNA-primase RepB domain-containing protein [Paenibacillus anseongense]|uniref:DNA-primase RepB domain-containing protein n=1 Tax=Paenibacillus anseongense TaxID=2682845 RepID=UPI002DB5C95D|nr:DNA-primase RepB domain-containing protein [Paenibacillus anseongense]MEC0271417.1 DNA-primase RepB domain-containing protein [Paenibacillus anseongense]